ncbi:MAG: glycosyltransferase family 39 protein [Candidatus Omnitrophota bacterium]
MSRVTAKILMPAGFLASLGVFYLFSYNSGYGYDALAYFNNGRAVADGYPLYSFIVSKSWLFYYFTAFLFNMGVTGRGGMAAAVTALYAVQVLGVFWLVAKHYHLRAAFISAALVSVSAYFMEMNFYEPESFVVITGLVACGLILKNLKDRSAAGLFPGGLWIGVGFCFKAVAAFYLAGAAVFMFVWNRARRILSNRQIIRAEIIFISGFLVPLCLGAAYFTFTGRIRQHIGWNYYFPFFGYAPGVFWMYKLYSKLMWFWLLIAAVFCASFRKNIKEIYGVPLTGLSLAMGMFSLAALAKNQASHYVFPGAVFLSVYAGLVLDKVIGSLRNRKAAVICGSLFALMCMACLASACLYNPGVFKRFLTVKKYPRDREIKAVIQRLVPEGKNALFFRDNTYLYWVSERYPNVPYLYHHVQVSYYIQNNPDVLTVALADPDLALVEYNPAAPGIMDEAFLEKASNREIMAEFGRVLERDFRKIDTGVSPYIFWVRKDAVDGADKAGRAQP